MAIRCALLMQNYATARMWSDDLLHQAQNFLSALTLQLSQTECAPTDEVIQSIVNALSGNLNTVEVFSILQQWIAQSQLGVTGGNPGELSRALDSLLGLAI